MLYIIDLRPGVDLYLAYLCQVTGGIYTTYNDAKIDEIIELVNTRQAKTYKDPRTAS